MSKSTNKINGWLVISKPVGIGSTNVVSKLKWALSPSRIGHAGTLDPLAEGVLPIAFGHATKLIPFVMDGLKTYEFQVTWGSETETDDREGSVIQISDLRPTEQAIRDILPRFIGDISQVPPAYSALKINGRRSYDLARSGEQVALTARPIHIKSLDLLRFDSESADFRVVCGKGTYVRSLGRDIGRTLGCLGYITRLCRTACGPFKIEEALPFSLFNTQNPDISLLPLDTALSYLPTLLLSDVQATRLRQGQRIPISQISSSFTCAEDTIIRLIHKDHLIGLAQVRHHVLHPYRIFNDAT